VDQNRLIALQNLLNSAPAIFRRQGAVVATWRTVVSRRTGEARKLGPYYSLRYRDGGRQQAFYLGRSSAFADAAKKVLAMLQAPRRQSLKIARLRRAIKESLRRSKAELDRQLREQFGARLKGWEIRGWTKSGMPRMAWLLAMQATGSSAALLAPRVDCKSHKLQEAIGKRPSLCRRI
ncbi:MAG: hypothetical protein AAF961_14430, partial [Planctomycetota bacterium]